MSFNAAPDNVSSPGRAEDAIDDIPVQGVRVLRKEHLISDAPGAALVDLQAQVVDQVGRSVVSWDDSDGEGRQDGVAAVTDSQLDAVSGQCRI